MVAHATFRATQPHDRSSPRQRTVLIVEPEALLRWSLAKYLARWFQVFAADSAAAAARILDGQVVDAAVLSEDLPDRAVDGIEARLRAQKLGARVVRTATGREDAAIAPTTPLIEKPFDLKALVGLLRKPVERASARSAGRRRR